MARAAGTRRLNGLALAGIALMFATLSFQEIRSVDFWWQLATGRLIVESGALPRVDVFTYTVPGNEWIEVRWLFYVLSYVGWSLGGPALLIVAQTAVLTAAFGLIAASSARALRTLPGCAVLFLAVWAASGRFVVRPEIVSFLLVAIFLVLLDRHRRGIAGRSIWWLPVLQVLWSNLHTVFVFGPVIAWIFVAGDRISGVREPTRRRRLVAVAAAVTAACLVNPHGPRGAAFPFLLFREMHAGSILGRAIDELRSPLALERWGWDLWAAAALLAISGGSFFLGRRRPEAARLMVWVAFSYLALQSVRNVAVLGFVAGWVALRNLEEALEERPGIDRLAARWPAAHAGVALVAVAAAWYVATDRYAVRHDPDRRFGLGIVPWYQAEEATRFLLTSGASPQLFHEMADGSYLIWAARGRFPVFIDGRNEVFGEDFIRAYLATAMGTRDFDAVVERWGIRTVMLLREDLGRLVDVVRRSPNWVLVHLDARELVFVRDVPEHAEVIRRFRIDPRTPWVPRGPQPEERPTGWWRRFGGVGRPWHSLGMAQSLLHVGAVDAALAYLEKAHREFPDHREVRLALAQTYRSRGRDAEAERLVAGLRISPEESARMAEMLAGLALNEGRTRDAAEVLGRVAASRPSDPALAARLGKARFEAGDYRGASAAYATATRLDPGRPDHWLGLGHCLALLGDDAGAIDAYRGALRADANTAQAHYNLGILLGRRGDTAGRERHLREALRLQPGYEPARRALTAGP